MPLDKFLDDYVDEKNPKSKFYFPAFDKYEALREEYDITQCFIICRETEIPIK